MRADVKGENTTHVDMGVTDRRDLPEHVVGKGLGCLSYDGLNVLRIPRHYDIGDQGEGSGNRPQLLRRAATLGTDGAMMDGTFEAVHGLALIQQI